MKSPSPIRVVLAVEHELVRSGITSLLSHMQGVQIVAAVGYGCDLLNEIRSNIPDLVISDIDLPRITGLTAVRRIKERSPLLPVIVLSTSLSADAVKRAVEARVNGFVHIGAPVAELELAIRTVINEGSHFSRQVAERLLEPTHPKVEDQLTPRQVQIRALLAHGKSSKEIGSTLRLSSKTVDAHRTRIMDRLQLSDVASLTLYAVRNGLVIP